MSESTDRRWFLGLGAAKCGTTAVASLLAEHPEIGFPLNGQKEVHFFDYPESITAASLASYVDGFAAGKICGEWTPSYLFTPECRDLIHEHLGPDVKFVVALRNPVDRAYSHYCHAVKNWDTPAMAARGYPKEDLSFVDAIDAEEERLASGRYHIRHQSYFAKGLYARQLQWYFERFSPQSFFIYLLEDHMADPAANLRDMCEFLGVDPSVTFDEVERVSNSQTDGSVDTATREMLLGRYSDDIASLEQILGRDLEIWRAGLGR